MSPPESDDLRPLLGRIAEALERLAPEPPLASAMDSAEAFEVAAP